jgi:hypothetical protein
MFCFDHAVASSSSIETALALIGWGYFYFRLWNVNGGISENGQRLNKPFSPSKTMPAKVLTKTR